MRTQVQKWGNSLALRIPKVLANEVGLDSESPVELSIEDGSIVIRPTRIKTYDLKDLVDGITAENVHPATDFGTPVGRESW